ncbi:hypothetical protein [Candidatus Albibeggiatoa sp. nov. BB20]|uniref:hypothetical protein n=1 Tax=Candidatus Albibeggiatoa sp. nov. BB20 TaxID=3162723 RepID=UPI0033652FE4
MNKTDSTSQQPNDIAKNADPTCEQINDAARTAPTPDVLGVSTASINGTPIASENTYRYNSSLIYANRLTSCLGLWWLDDKGGQCMVHIVAVNEKGEGIINPDGTLSTRGENTVTEVNKLVDTYKPKNDEMSSFGDNQNSAPWPTFLSKLYEETEIIPEPVSGDKEDSCFKCTPVNDGCKPL